MEDAHPLIHLHFDVRRLHAAKISQLYDPIYLDYLFMLCDSCYIRETMNRLISSRSILPIP